MKLPKILLYQILGGETVKKSPNRSTDNGDIEEKAKRPVSELVCCIYLTKVKLSF